MYTEWLAASNSESEEHIQKTLNLACAHFTIRLATETPS